MPLNILDAQFRSFARDVVPKLVSQNIAVLGMKPMAAGLIPLNGVATGIECLHYALTLPASVVITGISNTKFLDQAFEAVRTFKPLGDAEVSALLAKTRWVALSGRLETYKTTAMQDSTAYNPQWMS
jgi:hypothetical protein